MMPKKYLKVANAIEAKQKSIAARDTKYPSWYQDQLAKHLARPNVNGHPDRYVNDLAHHIVEDSQTGECELHIEEDYVQYFDQGDQGNMTDVQQIEDDQGGQ